MMTAVEPTPPAPALPTDEGGGPEKTQVTLGLVPLTDCAPIAVAVELGFFADAGLNVTTTREQSWAGIRDKVAFGVLDGAQMLATMPLCTTLGVGGLQCDMSVGVTLGLNGNAITLANWLCDEAEERTGQRYAGVDLTADGLAAVVHDRAANGKAKLRLGVVFPMSTHDLELRYWLAAAGLDPDRDVELVVVPPPRMVDALRNGELAGFCVGEPWNTVAVEERVGRVVMTKHALWNNSPEKVLGVTRAWAEQHPWTHLALITALIRAGQWLDETAHRERACAILSQPQYVGVDPDRLRPSLTGQFRVAADAGPVRVPDCHVFHRYQANLPWRSQAWWWLTQVQRWGAVPDGTDLASVVDHVLRDDLYRTAAARLGLPTPEATSKTEGTHAEPWTLDTPSGPVLMGPDRFFDDSTVLPPTRPRGRTSPRLTGRATS